MRDIKFQETTDQRYICIYINPDYERRGELGLGVGGSHFIPQALAEQKSPYLYKSKNVCQLTNLAREPRPKTLVGGATNT